MTLTPTLPARTGRVNRVERVQFGGRRCGRERAHRAVFYRRGRGRWGEQRRPSHGQRRSRRDGPGGQQPRSRRVWRGRQHGDLRPEPAATLNPTPPPETAPGRAVSRAQLY